MTAIAFTQILSPEAKLSGELPDFAKDRATLKNAYRAMIRTRTFDAKAVALQRTGKLGTYASSLGQEAVGIGVARAMQAADVLLPSFREHGAQLVRGVSPTELFLYWSGDERGNCYQAAVLDFPNSIPVGSNAPHAAGVALALKLEKNGAVAVATFGDGATSKGDVYEAMNVAGAWSLPVLFVVCNNQWAISLPRHAQTAAETLAQKAQAAGFQGEQVDGNDVIAMEHVTRRALSAMRETSHPHLIEALTYRMSDHTTVDDASRYRKDEEVSAHWKEDPIARLRHYLFDSGAWTSDDEQALLESCEKEIEEAEEEYLAIPSDGLDSIFDHTYEELTEDLRAQRAALLRGGGGDG